MKYLKLKKNVSGRRRKKKKENERRNKSRLEREATNNIHAAIVEIILSSVNVSKLWQNFI